MHFTTLFKNLYSSKKQQDDTWDIIEKKIWEVLEKQDSPYLILSDQAIFEVTTNPTILEQIFYFKYNSYIYLDNDDQPSLDEKAVYDDMQWIKHNIFNIDDDDNEFAYIIEKIGAKNENTKTI